MELKQKQSRKVGELRLRVKLAFLPIMDPVSNRRWVFEMVWVVQRYAGKLLWEVWTDVEVKTKLGEFESYKFTHDFIDGPQPIPKE
jgi:hypothetical protein